VTELAPAILGALPELVLALGATVLTMVGPFVVDQRRAWLTRAALLTLVGALALVPTPPDGLIFGGLFVVDGFGKFMKILVLGATAWTLLIAEEGRQSASMRAFEYPVLVLFSALGMLATVSANNLMSLYLGLEMMSIPLYVLTALKRESRHAGEAGIKYFVLGALASALLLYGCALLYGFTGTTDFDALAVALPDAPPLGAAAGLVFLVAGIAFKLSAAPFHMWTPDVYEGAPTPVTAFLAAAPKVAAGALMLRVLFGPLIGLADVWMPAIAVLAVLSMTVGAFGALRQTGLKRLLAYGTIGHSGYIFVGIAAGTPEGIHGACVYLAIYAVMTIGAFACLLAMHRSHQPFEQVEHLAGIGRRRPMFALAFSALLLSMAGLPPLAGFLAKLYVFRAAVEADLFWLAVVGVLASVVAAAYYFRVVYVMYFADGDEDFEHMPGRRITWTVTATALTALLFLIVAPVVVEAAARAAGTLGL